MSDRLLTLRATGPASCTIGAGSVESLGSLNSARGIINDFRCRSIRVLSSFTRASGTARRFCPRPAPLARFLLTIAPWVDERLPTNQGRKVRGDETSVLAGDLAPETKVRTFRLARGPGRLASGPASARLVGPRLDGMFSRPEPTDRRRSSRNARLKPS